MAYVQSKVMKRRLQDKRRVSGAALLREELELNSTSSLLFDGVSIEKEEDKGVMMANFEEWIKMATDNKINTKNSWNFALIDYFHDLNVLRGTDNNINFQKASATLDGCVKIYSSRVDSVATETGRLLSGLATRRQEDGVNDEDEEEGEEEEEGGGEEDDVGKDDDSDVEGEELQDKNTRKNKKNKKKNSRAKARELGDTLTTVENIKIKKLSQELSIDPLFKKTLAEFDEGGAKSLLLNTLNMDSHSRVVFDASSTNANNTDEGIKVEPNNNNNNEEEEEEEEDVEMSGIDEEEVDISPLKSFLFNDVQDSSMNDNNNLDSFTVCPSFGHLESVLKDINKAKSILNEFQPNNEDINNDDNNNDYADRPDFIDSVGGADYDFDDDDDNNNENSFGEMEREAAAVIFQDELNANQKEVGDDTGVIASVVDQDLMAYFDSSLKRNWAGPEHWKVKQWKKVKEVNPQEFNNNKQKRPKEVFKIDFMTIIEDEDDEESKIFTKGKTSTMLPIDQRESLDHHLLPDDLYFSSEKLTKLFLKPSQKLNIFRRKVNVCSIEGSLEPEDDQRTNDATFWAENYKEMERQEEEEEVEGNDDPYFEGNEDYSFDEAIVSVIEGNNNNNNNNNNGKIDFGTQLITGGTKVKPEYVNYSKKAKNVNVKLLKDNLWNSIEKKREIPERQFTEIVQDIEKLYPKEEKKDLSTSFCFICLLHLANEHGLNLESNESLSDVKVSGLK